MVYSCVSVRLVCVLLLLPVLFSFGACQREKNPLPPIVNTSLPADILTSEENEQVPFDKFRYYLELKGVNAKEVSREKIEGFLKEFIIDIRLAKEARGRGLAEAEMVRMNSERFDWQVLPNLYYKKQFLEKVKLEEKDFNPFFDNLNDVAVIRVAVLANEDEAKTFLANIGKEGTFEELLGKYSIGNTAKKGGNIEGVYRGDIRFTGEEKDAIFSAPLDKLLGPFKNNIGGYSIVKVVQRTNVAEQKKAIREGKKNETLEMKAGIAYLTRLNEEMVKSEIEINEDFFEGKKKTPGRPYLAWVKGKYIYPQDLGVSTSSESHSVKDYRGNLNKLIKMVVATDLARKAGLTELAEYKMKRDVFLISQLVTAMMEDDFHKARFTASEEELRKYYREFYRPFVYSIWVVVNGDRSLVEQARKEAGAGSDLSGIAEKFSDDMSRLRGGAIGFMPLTAYDKATASVIESLKPGEVSSVFPLNEKFAVVRLLEKKNVAVPAMEEVRKEVTHNVILRKRSSMVEERREEAYRKMPVKVDYEKLSRVKL